MDLPDKTLLMSGFGALESHRGYVQSTRLSEGGDESARAIDLRPIILEHYLASISRDLGYTVKAPLTSAIWKTLSTRCAVSEATIGAVNSP